MTKWQKYLTCKQCESPLLDNDLVKNAYKANNTWAWALRRIKQLIEAIEDKERFSGAKYSTSAGETTSHMVTRNLNEIIDKVELLGNYEKEVKE
jgi:hypothetical protein